jgi:hypothetical protein
MTLSEERVRLGAAVLPFEDLAVDGDFVTIDGARWSRIRNVDRMPPFLMSIASDSDAWLFIGSNGPFTAGRGTPDMALFPYQTVDRILGDPASAGARTTLLVRREGDWARWEPWLDADGVYRTSRTIAKRVDGTAVLFEEVNHDLGLAFRWRLSSCEAFGLVRRAEIEELRGEPVDVRYLDGWHRLVPPGVDVQMHARMSYLATAYMHHERLPGSPVAVYALNAAISDRAEPSESLRVAAAWSLGHPDPVLLLSGRQVDAFRRGDDVVAESEVRGEVGAYLVADRVRLGPGGHHEWYTVGDTRLDHPAVVRLLEVTSSPASARAALESAVVADGAGVRRRIAAADGLQATADEAAVSNHAANVLFNIMRGGSFTDGYAVPVDDLAAAVAVQNREVADRHRDWLASLEPGLHLHGLIDAAGRRGDPQLARIVGAYLPLTYSRRHGDPSRPWNRFSIRVRDRDGRPVRDYEGNWRDIFQNWEALAESFPDYLPQFISVFLGATTADGYNPYRITRSGIDWEVVDPRDPWSHIGYWGDHQIVYLLRLLESEERHHPGALQRDLGARRFPYARVPYCIAGLDEILADPRSTIRFERDLHEAIVAEQAHLGADARLHRDASGEVRLVSLAEKLLVPVLTKLTNFVPGGGIWLNTQRPEWNDANNALVGWGLSVVTLSAIRRYLAFLDGLFDGSPEASVSGVVARLLEDVTAILAGIPAVVDDVERLRLLVALGRAGEAHRAAVYAQDLGEPVRLEADRVRALVAAALRAVDATLLASRRPDGLFHSYNLLRVDGERASIAHLGPMLEGQVGILDSGLLSDHEAVEVLRALRTSALYRPDQHSYLLYPDRALAPFLERNTLAGPPPTTDPTLFVADATGAWHFQADLSTAADVERRLDDLRAEAGVRRRVMDLWRETFDHDAFTGRSGTFFMFEGLGSIYWHMIAKLLLATQGAHRRASDPAAAAALAVAYHDIRDGLGFRKSPRTYGAFPTDPYSHTPSHHGAQQPGMTGQVKEQILARLGELGVEVSGGAIRFRPTLLSVEEFFADPATFSWIDEAGRERAEDLPARALAFTLCQVPVVYRRGLEPTIRVDWAGGRAEIHPGDRLDAAVSAAIFGRTGQVERLVVTVPATALHG